MKKSIHSQVAAKLRSDGISIDDREAAIASLKECVAPKRCVAAYEDLYRAHKIASEMKNATADDVMAMVLRLTEHMLADGVTPEMLNAAPDDLVTAYVKDDLRTQERMTVKYQSNRAARAEVQRLVLAHIREGLQ